MFNGNFIKFFYYFLSIIILILLLIVIIFIVLYLYVSQYFMLTLCIEQYFDAVEALYKEQVIEYFWVRFLLTPNGIKLFKYFFLNIQFFYLNDLSVESLYSWKNLVLFEGVPYKFLILLFLDGLSLELSNYNYSTSLLLYQLSVEPISFEDDVFFFKYKQ